jgi:hypothetical protein
MIATDLLLFSSLSALPHIALCKAVPRSLLARRSCTPRLPRLAGMYVPPPVRARECNGREIELSADACGSSLQQSPLLNDGHGARMPELVLRCRQRATRKVPAPAWRSESFRQRRQVNAIPCVCAPWSAPARAGFSLRFPSFTRSSIGCVDHRRDALIDRGVQPCPIGVADTSTGFARPAACRR